MTAPSPPPDLGRRTPELEKIPKGSVLHRFYSSAHDPIYFDRSDRGRFNSPDGSFGVLYVAQTLAGAFAETFLRSPERVLIDTGFLKQKAYVRLVALEDLTLVRLAGAGLARFGATAEVTHGSLPYEVPQRWSAAITDHPVKAAGIAYHSRHDDTELCYALFDRIGSVIVEESRDFDLDRDWFWQMAERYGVGLAP